MLLSWNLYDVESFFVIGYIQYVPTVGVAFSTVQINDAIKFSILLTDLWARLVRITTVSHYCKHELRCVVLMVFLAARLLINRHRWCRTTCKRPVQIPWTARVPARPNLLTSRPLHSSHSSVRRWLGCPVVWQHFQGFCWLSCSSLHPVIYSSSFVGKQN